jgi:signal transduction histidine kinase
VEDSGIGIPEEAQEHIFERFYRVDKSHSREIGGTGLGLAITRSAIAMHRGVVRVYSKEGEGTTFNVRIPLVYVE